MSRVLKTLFWTMVYSTAWVLLELIIDKHIVNRTIDNIIMILFMPMIYKAMENTNKEECEDCE